LSAHLGRSAAPTGPPLVLREPQFQNSDRAFSVPDERPCLHFSAAEAPNSLCNPDAGIGRK